MSTKATVDTLFKEHSFEEIESVRHSLAVEIEKRTELLKSIVKEKYRDVIETSDAIQSMKVNLTKLQNSIQKLDGKIVHFYERIEETSYTKRTLVSVQSASGNHVTEDISQATAPARPDADKNLNSSDNEAIRQLLSMSTEIWDHFDSGNLKLCVKSYNECSRMLKKIQSAQNSPQETTVLHNLEARSQRAEQMIKNFLWYKIQSAETNQIGIIAGSDEEELYSLSFQSSIEFLVANLRKDISDISFQAQIRRYQQYSYFNTSTNTIDSEVNDLKHPPSDYVQVPKAISIELSAFLFDTCRVINTIAGFSLTRSTILSSFRVTMLKLLEVYTDLVATIDSLNDGSKRRRAMQLYFDLMYIRVLLNTSKDLELIEELDPKITALMGQYERMLDTIELYIVSDALHTNVLRLSTSTIRLYGLLVPYLR